jgi:hypothetical protein
LNDDQLKFAKNKNRWTVAGWKRLEGAVTGRLISEELATEN